MNKSLHLSVSHLFIPLFFYLPSENGPPVVQPLPFSLRAFQGENFIYQLQAEDHEGSAVHFSLISGPEGASLSPSGLLMWKASVDSTDTHTFQFTVTDDCNAEIRDSVQVRPHLFIFYLYIMRFEMKKGQKVISTQGLNCSSLEEHLKNLKHFFRGIVRKLIRQVFVVFLLGICALLWMSAWSFLHNQR